MAHSKRNTSLAFFTSHERSLLRSSWGSQSATLTRDSFLPFGSCQLCLLPSRDPVTCVGAPTTAEPPSSKTKTKKPLERCHLFCRECAVSNLLAQRKEIKRLEKAAVRDAAEAGDADVRAEEAARARTVEDFERVQLGLEVKFGGHKDSRPRIVGREGGKVLLEEGTADGGSGDGGVKKRKFELDEAELLRIAQDERKQMRKMLWSEQADEAAKSAPPSFWVQTQTPTSNHASVDANAGTLKTQTKKLHPLCPGSAAQSSRTHGYSLKTLVSVKFLEAERQARAEEGAREGKSTRSCPACQKALSNASKAVLARPCGHVLCKACVERFVLADEDEDGDVRCYVCSEDLSDHGEKEKGGGKGKDRIWPGLVEISSEGTGYAGAGGSTVKKQGTVFQC